MVIKRAKIENSGVTQQKSNLTATIEEVTDFGLMSIKLNQKIYRPCFLNETSVQIKLEEVKKIDELNVKEYFLKCNVRIKSSVDPSKFGFGFKLEKWQNDTI